MSRPELLSEMDKVLEKPEIRSRHSFFQLRYFVLGKEPTIQARLRKCLAELGVRRETIENLRLSIEETKDDIELANIDIKEQKETLEDPEKVVGKCQKERVEIQTRKLERRKRNAEKTLKKLGATLREAEEEAEFFLQAYKDLERVEPLKSFDDLKTNIEYWNARYTDELKLRLLLQKPLDLELAKCILAMDKQTPIRQEFVSMLDQIEEQGKLAVEERRALMKKDKENDNS